MILERSSWSLDFSWTPKLVETAENSSENDENSSDANERIFNWIDFCVNDDSSTSKNIHDHSRVLMLQKTGEESCTLTIAKPGATNYEAARFKRVKITSKARRVEISSKRQGYIRTVTGERVVDDYYQVDIADLKARDLILKFVSFSNKCHVEVLNLQIHIEETNLNGTFRAPGSQVEGPKIDMGAVYSMLGEMDQPLSDNAQKFMNQILLMKQKQPPIKADEVDLSSMMSLMASISPHLPQPPIPQLTTQPEPSTTNKPDLDEVSTMVDKKMEHLEEKMMQRLDESVTAMEGRLMGKLDLLLAALDSSTQNDET